MNLLKQIKATTSRIEKEQILKGATELEKLTLAYAYNPYFVYHQRELGRIDWDNLGEPDELMFSLLDSLRTKRISGHAAWDTIKDFANDFGDLIKLVVRKDLECGITATTINKVFPKLVPQFKVQLAKEVPLSKLELPLLAQLKYDGVRLVCLDSGSKVEWRTRNGKLVYLPEFTQLVKGAFSEANFMLDGEITSASGKTEDRAKVSGMINSAMHGGVIDETKLVFNVFDAMGYDNFLASKCGWDYNHRANLARKILSEIANPYITFAETVPVSSIEQINKLYADKIDQGYEGLILKSEKHLYTFKRANTWAKMKETKSVELTCTGVQEGTGKYEGMIGALICEGLAEGKTISVKVGSGLTDLDRAMSHDSYLHNTIEVKYNTVIQDSTTKVWSLFLPRYVCIRFDKVA